MRERNENMSWLVGALVSGVVHVGAGVGAARYGTFAAVGPAQLMDAGGEVLLVPPEDSSDESERSQFLPPPPPPMQLPRPPDDPSQPPLRLGIRESSQSTEAWLGFDSPDEHSGAMSTLDQAALALDPGVAGTPGDAAEANGAPAAAPTPPAPSDVLASQTAPSVLPTPQAAATPAMDARTATPETPQRPLPEGEAKPGDARGQPTDSSTPRESPAEPAPKNSAELTPPQSTSGSESAGNAASDATTPVVEGARQSPDAVPIAPSEVIPDPLLPPMPAPSPVPLAAPAGSAPPPSPAQDAQPASPGDEASTTPTPNPTTPTDVSAAPPTPGTQGSAKATPGNKSDRESDAASRKGPIEVRPGKPAAGQGLEIQTVRPQWSITTRLTAAPRNPMVRIVFGADGRVKAARFLVGQDTGTPDIDGPLLDAIYRWTARGKAIDDLPKKDPKAGVPLIMRIVLRG